MAWCRQATSHYLSQCWPRSLSPYDVTRPQWVKRLSHTYAGYKLYHHYVCKWPSIKHCQAICWHKADHKIRHDFFCSYDRLWKHFCWSDDILQNELGPMFETNIELKDNSPMQFIYSVIFGSYKHQRINSLWPSDAIRRYRTGPILVQIMACCLTAPSHYLNQCWLVISMVHKHSLEIDFTRDAWAINQ